MAKKSKRHARSRAQKIADEKLFLKLLKENERKTSIQKTVSKRGGDGSNRITGVNKERTKRGKQKPVGKSKVSIQTKPDTRGKNVSTTKNRPTPKRNEPGRLHTEPRKRGKEEINYSFDKVRSIDKKINLFKEGASKGIKGQLKRHGGKPPRGIIVTVRDKKGREKTEISPLDFVVNESNIQEFVNNMLERMKDDFMEWKDMQENGETDTDANPYADYNPDTIASITIKFII